MLKGSKHKPEIIEKIKERMLKGKQGFKKTTFKKGHKPFPWWKNPVHREAARERMRAMSWKGDDVGYAGIHNWLEREFGKASRCENIKCLKKSSVHEWALLKNKSYTRKRDNFWMLCKSCHKKYDVYFKQEDFEHDPTVFFMGMPITPDKIKKGQKYFDINFFESNNTND